MRIVRYSLLVLLLSACSATTKHKVLSVLFDGVPEPGSGKAPAEKVLVTEAPVPELEPEPPAPDQADLLSAAELAAGGQGAIDQLPLRPVPRRTKESWQPTGAALEGAVTWEDAVSLLPVDPTGGADWVTAVNDGLTVPQQVLNAEATAPFTLDTLLMGISVEPGSPFLDFTVEMIPQGKPLFKVDFPHSSHTLFLACSSCHPGVQEWDDMPMDKILGGRACGKCHGRVSFDPEPSCARCHTNLVPPDVEAIDTEVAAARESPLPASPELLALGEKSYQQNCSFCHGDQGDGKGRFARWLTTKPRDFTSGTYKFVNVTEGPARDLDLFRTITRGVPGTSMPPWISLPVEERWALVHYIKSFSDWFSEEEPREPITIAPPPPATAEVLDQGRSLYREAGCNGCHGETGAGDGASANMLRDNWGEPIRPFSFASGRPLKSGAKREDIFRTVTIGLPGTPMPGFNQSLSPDQIWSLVHFVSSLRGSQRNPFAVRGDIIFQRGGPADGDSDDAPGADDEGGDDFWGAGGSGDDGGDFWGAGEGDDDDEGGGDFWGTGEGEGEGGGDSGGDFWGVGEDTAAAEPAAEEDFWGVGEDAAPAAPAAEEDFWGVGEDTADSGDGDDFWGTEEDSGGGDDFWGEGDSGAAAAPAMASAHADNDTLIGELPMPPATFPHWFHRARLKCANCHPKVFEMKAGANPITMDAMRAGLYCAKCHNGKIAWEIGFTNCPRCHQARPGIDL